MRRAGLMLAERALLAAVCFAAFDDGIPIAEGHLTGMTAMLHSLRIDWVTSNCSLPSHIVNVQL